jgi:hypothetical protein
MRKLLLLLLPFTISGQTITLTPIGTQDVSGIPITVSHIIPGATTGTITQLTSNIPADRGRAATAIWTSANTDQALININYPAGFAPQVGSTAYTSGTLHANAWLTFGTNTYNSFNGWSNTPNVPTIHFTSVNNGSTDNNISYATTETYTDPYWGDMFRIRYEGSYKYNVQGINTIIDIYFIKNQPTKYIVVLRTFLADGSNQEQIGVSNGSTWLAHNIISSTAYSSGQAWVIETQTTVGNTTVVGTVNTNASGQAVFSNPNNYQYKVTINTSQKFHNVPEFGLIYMMFMKGNLGPLQDWDFYTCDCNNSSTFDWDDINFCHMLYRTGSLHNKYVFTQAEKTTIESNANTNYYNTYFPTQIRTIENQNQFYIMGTGIHNASPNPNAQSIQ